MNEDTKELLSIIVKVGVVIWSLVAGLNYMAFITRSSDIEQLRKDITGLADNVSEDVYGQAVEANRTIASYRRANQVPVICTIIPNGWDDIKMIDVTKRG